MRPVALLALLLFTADGGATDPEALRARIRAQLEAANHCAASSDCVDLGQHCPFGCRLYVHRGEAERLRALLAASPPSCKYDCDRSRPPVCLQGRCVAKEP